MCNLSDRIIQDATSATCYHLATISDGDYPTFENVAEAVHRDLAEELDPDAYTARTPTRPTPPPRRSGGNCNVDQASTPSAQAVSNTSIHRSVGTTCDANRMSLDISFLR